MLDLKIEKAIIDLSSLYFVIPTKNFCFYLFYTNRAQSNFSALFCIVSDMFFLLLFNILLSIILIIFRK